MITIENLENRTVNESRLEGRGGYSEREKK
jgi:hypothetical protein